MKNCRMKNHLRNRYRQRVRREYYSYLFQSRRHPGDTQGASSVWVSVTVLDQKSAGKGVEIARWTCGILRVEGLNLLNWTNVCSFRFVWTIIRDETQGSCLPPPLSEIYKPPTSLILSYTHIFIRNQYIKNYGLNFM